MPLSQTSTSVRVSFIPVLSLFLLFLVFAPTGHLSAAETTAAVKMLPAQTVEVDRPFYFYANGAFGSRADQFVFAAKQTNGTDLPSWITISKETGLFTFKATTAQRGKILHLRLMVYDKYGGHQEATFYVLVDSAGNECTVEANADRLAKLLTCKGGEVRLRGETESGRYIWFGPEDFYSTRHEPLVKLPGIYYLDDPSGCGHRSIVEVRDTDEGCSGGTTKNQLPTATIGADRTVGDTPLTVNLNGSKSSDSDGKIIEYRYDWKGGSATGTIPTVTFLQEGTYEVTLTVTDNTGARSTDRITISAGGDNFVADQHWLEAECAEVGNNWREDNGSGASGGEFVYSPRYSISGAPSDRVENRVRFTVNAATAGLYNMFARIDINGTKTGSYWIRVNDGDWFAWYKDIGPKQDFRWSAYPKEMRLRAGKNTIDYAFREVNIRLDKVYITNTTDKPSGSGGAAMNCGGTVDDTETTAGPTPPPTGGSDEIWLEAECAQVGSVWTTTNHPLASGNKFVYVISGNSLNAPPEDEAENRVRFTFDAKAGSYRLFGRIAAANNTDDSYWVRLNGGKWYRWSDGMYNGQGFAWNAFNTALSLRDGKNTLDFAFREDGAKLDKLYLTNSANEPSGLGGSSQNCGSNESGTSPTSSLPSFAFEAECSFTNGNWVDGSDSDASNGRYLFFSGDNQMNRGDDQEAIIFRVDLREAGTYHLFLRMNGFDGGRNSFWVRVDNEEWKQMWLQPDGSSLTTNGFEWHKANDDGDALSFKLSTGTHLIKIANREAGTGLDKIYLSPNATVPTGDGPQAQSCSSATSQTITGVNFATRSSTEAADETAATGLPEEVNVEVYPNPADSYLNFKLASDHEGRVDVIVTDATGRRVRQLTYDKAGSSLSAELEVTDLPSGMYLLRILEADRQQVVPFVKR